MVAAGLFAVVGLAFTFLYVSTRNAFAVGSAQAFVQQQGTLIQEEIARQLRPAVALLQRPAGAGTTCGGVAAPAAVLIQITTDAAARDPLTPQSKFRCLLELQDGAGTPPDSFPQLYLCNVADPSPATSQISSVLGGACAAGTKRNLLFQHQGYHVSGTSLGAQQAATPGGSPLAPARLRVTSTCFQILPTMAGLNTCNNTTMGAGTAMGLYVRFDLTDGTLFQSQTAQVGLRLGFTTMLRN